MDYLKKLAKKFFQYEARLVLKRYKPKIIAIIGSVGKTLTREAIYLVISKKFFVRKSEKSFTAELGTALTVIGCNNGTGTFSQWVENILTGLKLILLKSHYPEYLILELDNDKPGDLFGVSSWLKPDILVVTAVGEVPSHIELFPSMKNFLLEAKTTVNSAKSDGVIVYNKDDLQASSLLKDVATRAISCGVLGGDVSGSEPQMLYGGSGSDSIPTGMSFDLNYKSAKYPVTILQSLGVGNEYACLLAFAVGVELGLLPEEISLSLNKYLGLPGRMNLISGTKNTIILDDSYNSSPIAMSQALNVFKQVSISGKKIAIIGDMLELGKYTADEHKQIAESLKGTNAVVVCFGLRARKIYDELISLGFESSRVFSADTLDDVNKILPNIIEVGDLILVKGSQAMRMERVVEKIMRHPEDKGEQLVRQEKEWLLR